jgi:hypothetical protein
METWGQFPFIQQKRYFRSRQAPPPPGGRMENSQRTQNQNHSGVIFQPGGKPTQQQKGPNSPIIFDANAGNFQSYVLMNPVPVIAFFYAA